MVCSADVALSSERPASSRVPVVLAGLFLSYIIDCVQLPYSLNSTKINVMLPPHLFSALSFLTQVTSSLVSLGLLFPRRVFQSLTLFFSPVFRFPLRFHVSSLLTAAPAALRGSLDT